jgi:hypothetical protein
MGLNLSTHQIAAELYLKVDDAQQMTAQLCSGIVEKKPEVILEGEVECDELYLIAGFKGQPAKVKKRGVSVGVPSPVFQAQGGAIAVRVKLFHNCATPTLLPGSLRASPVGGISATPD